MSQTSFLEAATQAVQHNTAALIATGIVLMVVTLIIFITSQPKRAKAFLDPQQFQTLPLAKIEHITHNVRRYVFSLPDAKMRVGLPTGQHISFWAKDADGKDVYRPYTPVTDDDTLGSVSFVIKVYPTGKMSQILDKLTVGDTMLMKGPRGRFQYQRNMKRAFGESDGALALLVIARPSCMC
eukprot:jgi/Chrzof1/10045/Cz04g25060.t1